jgi:hypothetical protein
MLCRGTYKGSTWFEHLKVSFSLMIWWAIQVNFHASYTLKLLNNTEALSWCCYQSSIKEEVRYLGWKTSRWIYCYLVSLLSRFPNKIDRTCNRTPFLRSNLSLWTLYWHSRCWCLQWKGYRIDTLLIRVLIGVAYGSNSAMWLCHSPERLEAVTNLFDCRS